MSGGVVLVGFGRRARDWHAAVRSHGGCEALAAFDPDAQARAAAEQAGLPAFATLDDALGVNGATAAIVCSPPVLHAPQAIACLDAGLKVLVEKPLALSLADASAVVDAAERAGLPAIAGHNFRHRPLERMILGALDSGAIGELRAAHVASARPAVTPDGEHTPLWDLAVHHLDLLRLRFGGTPDSVDARRTESAAGVTYSVRLEWEDRGGADYWLREGASVYHHTEWLEGSGGALRAVDGRVWLVIPTRRPGRLRASRGPAPEQVLLDALLGEGGTGENATAESAREALGTIAIVEAAVRSIALEEPVRPAFAAKTGPVS